MIECHNDLNDPFRCPSKLEYLRQAIALLPRGRAWQSHEDRVPGRLDRFPDLNSEAGEAESGSAIAGQPAIAIENTVLTGYWSAFAEVLEYFAQRACALVNEFFCPTVGETEELWGADYGFPDECDPWNSLCEKVAAQGGATCEYLVWAASRRGWVISCNDCSESRNFQAGCARAGRRLCTKPCEPNVLTITLRLSESPAFKTTSRPARGLRMMAGCTRLCAPSPEQIKCLIERVKPAHVKLQYVIA